MRDFRSVCRKQMELVIIIPHRDSMMKGYAMVFVMGWSMVEIRIIPYPPSLRRMAARTMDPAMGASTCALGSHRWSPYRGIFTMKAIIHASHRMLLVQIVGRLEFWYREIIKFRDPVDF